MENTQLKQRKLKIFSIKNLGERNVYDIEMPSNHNFILKGGVVAHNCKSHSYSYAITGYACAFLKHHYPLEWWCAVLNNASKNEVAEDFWNYCGHLIQMPDIKESGDSFFIKDDKIIAPISLLQGIGEKAQEWINRHRPYTDIYEFCEKIHKYKKDTSKVIENGKTRLGSAPVNRGVVYTLIVSDAMNSFFPKDYTLIDKLQEFEKALAKPSGAKISPVDTYYADLNALQRFQVKKIIFPAFNNSLIDVVKDLDFEFIKYDDSSKRLYYFHSLDEKKDDKYCPISNFKEISISAGNYSDEKAAFAFVRAQRLFKYKDKDGNNKEACEIVLDIDGNEFKTVKWPKRNGLIDQEFKQNLVGSILIVLLYRYNSDKPYFISKFNLIQPPLKE